MMNKEEYKNFKKMSAVERILFMNKGTIAENLRILIELSNWEEKEQNNEIHN